MDGDYWLGFSLGVMSSTIMWLLLTVGSGKC